MFAARVAKPSASTALPGHVRDAIATPGRPLDAAVRTQLEPRFGHDFGRVRVHDDATAQRSADALHAHAYTHGTDVVFGAGEYAPHSSEGRDLLAHELTHVVEQAGNPSAPRVQCKLKAPAGTLDSYFASFGVHATHQSGVYSHPGVSVSNINAQIVIDLLRSPRVFNPAGTFDMPGKLDEHVKARKGIIDFAAKKKYKFAAGEKFKMNPKYWKVTPKEYSVREDVDPKEAVEDVNVNPQEYAIACEAATKITMIGGSASELTEDGGVHPNDWIPGDWGYIKNLKFSGLKADAGLEGENLIYVGHEKFWGHFSTTNAYKTYDEWFDTVAGWNGGAQLQSHRIRPTRGLV